MKETIPISMARLANQIVFICAFLTNFLPALVPLPKTSYSEDEVEDYFKQLSDSDSDSEFDLIQILPLKGKHKVHIAH